MAFSLSSVQRSVTDEMNRDWSDKTVTDIRMMCYAGLAEETGEVLGIAKRRARKLLKDKEAASSEHLKEELGDILWYLAAVASLNEMSLDEIWELNRVKLEERYGIANERIQ